MADDPTHVKHIIIYNHKNELILDIHASCYIVAVIVDNTSPSQVNYFHSGDRAAFLEMYGVITQQVKPIIGSSFNIQKIN